ncbi:unnamed protein product [Nesidiocoris tenuis]|uniref:CCHC-type domain-containing protein n=1 Tax=Nesidiocoris tenuis TaxID=355587 RepID=A0A6H5GSM0_9HEMI|nr:unnamed protein product [Nesidiocoris tenuis]
MSQLVDEFDSNDDVSLDGHLATEMFADPIEDAPGHMEENLLKSPQPDQADSETLRIQAAKTSDEVLVRYLEELKSNMVSGFGQLGNIVQELDKKYSELSQMVISGAAVQQSSESASISDTPGTSKTQNAVLPGNSPMEVDDPSIPNALNSKKRSSVSVPLPAKDEPYRARRIDSIRFRPLEHKLEKEELFKYWKRSVIGAVETQECLFLLDPSAPVPDSFSEYDTIVAKTKKLVSINPEMLTSVYVKTIFELAIEETVTYKKAELHGFKFTMAELRDMLLEEQLRSDQSSAGNSCYSMFRNRVASLRGRGGIKGKRGVIPGKSARSLPNPRMTAATNNKVTKREFCAYCKKRGHTKAMCFRANKLCFKCGKSDSHFAANCPNSPLPLKKPSVPSRKLPESRRSQYMPSQKRLGPLAHPGEPKVFKMPLGQAKRLASEFQPQPDSVFAIVGSENASDDTPTWVAMGANEQELAGTMLYLSEKKGKNQAFAMTEVGVIRWEGVHRFLALQGWEGGSLRSVIRP